MLPKVAVRVCLAAGRGRSFNVAAVITPKVPSEPTNNVVKS